MVEGEYGMVAVEVFFSPQVKQLENERKKWQRNEEHIGKLVEELSTKVLHDRLRIVAVAGPEVFQFFIHLSTEPGIPNLESFLFWKGFSHHQLIRLAIELNGENGIGCWPGLRICQPGPVGCIKKEGKPGAKAAIRIPSFNLLLYRTGNSKPVRPAEDPSTIGFDHGSRVGHGKKDQEKERGGKQVHAYRVKVPDPTAPAILQGYESRPEKQAAEGIEEFPVEMKNIINKMFHHSPGGLVTRYVFLAAILAIPAGYQGSAVKAVFFKSFWLVGHANFS